MKPHPLPWNRLVAAARQAPIDVRDESAPLGFASRVSALGVSRVEPTFSALFARFSLRALGACALLMTIGVIWNLPPVLNEISVLAESESIVVSDPVAEWFEAAS